MTASDPARGDNPRWLAALVTALPVALAALFVIGSSAPDTRRPPAAVSRYRPSPAHSAPPPDPNTTLVRAP
ncbi:hypothetical protein [Frigoriglobus tundricola]|uniref:Uncharacterized protein n=1 Tax=Frigoriglobus tundricola TaxID=2774151 RepID=A0A6M5Z601_9BACT|nr:hypothetical protein [Frigoriglobus tundricola]QJX00844.1 hypothetical protein FTUN_8482 [Frigoriglobus tundricola]